MVVNYLRSLVVLCFSMHLLHAAPPPKKGPPRDYLPPALSWMRNVEAVQMLAAIASGQPPDSGNVAWFHPGQSQYTRKWLVERMDKNHDGIIGKDEFTGAAEWFRRL